MPRCCAINCSLSYEEGVKLFRIPQGPRNFERRNIWLHRIGRRDWNPDSARLCEAHFTGDQFESNRVDGVKKLKPNAVPSIFSNVPKKSSLKTKHVPRVGKVPSVKETSDHCYAQPLKGKVPGIQIQSKKSKKSAVSPILALDLPNYSALATDFLKHYSINEKMVSQKVEKNFWPENLIPFDAAQLCQVEVIELETDCDSSTFYQRNNFDM